MSRLGSVAWQVARRADEAVRQARRAALVAQVRKSAWMAHATVELDLRDDLVVGTGVRVVVEPGTHSVLRLGWESRLDDRVLIILKGGQLLAGDRVEVRRDVVLNLAGTLRVDGETPISWGSVIHCSNDVWLERMCGVAEQVTIADSSHFFTTPDEHFWHNVRTGSVRVGQNTWICPKATLTRGADVGSHCIVGSNSVVTGVVPDGHLASGVPAVVRPLPLPWVVSPGTAAGGSVPR